MNAKEIIRKKKEAKSITAEEIAFLVSGYTKGEIPDYQFSAFLMAVCLNGMKKEETAALTKEMLYSGKIIDLSSIEGIKIDKHSTGGVGDKTSLILAPIAAAAGVKVPMISGRGLGNTGGTLDKLDSINGFKTTLNLAQYKKIINTCGAVLIGQTKEIAPADKKIYALRDATETVEAVSLISASIMSKKLAEGIDGLVLDIKVGSGAFMKNIKEAKTLANSLVDIAKAFDKKVMGFITEMSQPLGNYVGNWLEVYESIMALHGEKIDDLMEVTFNLSGAMIFMAKKAGSLKEGIEISKEMIKNGKAFDKFVEIVKLQGGDTKLITNPEKYPKAKHNEKIYADKTGWVKEINAYDIGIASNLLGAGRMQIIDKIDPASGIIFYPKVGARIKKGDLIAELFTDKKNMIDEAKTKTINSITLSKEKTTAPKMIKSIIK